MTGGPRAAQGRARPWLLFLLLLALLGLCLGRGWLELPPAWNPWMPLDVQAPPNLMTPLKLRLVREDPARCTAALATSALRWEPVEDRDHGDGCVLSNSVRLRGGPLQLGESFLATCQLAVAFAIFEHHGLQPAAQAVYGQPVVGIEHYGSYACRNIAGSQRRSQHATANALRIAGFRLADGRRITLARAWNGDEREQRFLRLVREAACKPFNTVLGPEYNAAHRDHLHLDMGRARICR